MMGDVASESLPFRQALGLHWVAGRPASRAGRGGTPLGTAHHITAAQTWAAWLGCSGTDPGVDCCA